MATELTKTQWSEILVHQELTNETDLSIFQALYSFEEHKAYASQVALLLGYKGRSPHAPLNSEVGRYAKRIAKFYDIQFTDEMQENTNIGIYSSRAGKKASILSGNLDQKLLKLLRIVDWRANNPTQKS